MKKLLLLLFCMLCMGYLRTQTVDRNAVDGEIYVKVRQGSTVAFADYHGGDPKGFSPEIQQIVFEYDITDIEHAFDIKNDLFSKIYRFKFNDKEQVNKLIVRLSSLNYIEYAEKVSYNQLFCTSEAAGYWTSTNAYHLNLINACCAWLINIGNPSVVVAVTDNEFNVNHQDLTGKFTATSWDVADNDANLAGPNASFDHGTHVAGIVGAISNNGVGVASLGRNLSIMGVKVTNNTAPFGGSQITHGYQGIVYAANNNADVINCSWGGYLSSATEQAVINWAYSQGSIVVAAAGNNNNNTVTFPASYNNVFSVANTDGNDIKSPSSTFGTWVDISAPGHNIYSTTYQTNNITYGLKTGTSMASPLVSALCGLIISQNPGYSNAQVLNCITSTAININALNPTHSGQLGAGRIDACAALGCVAPVVDYADFTANQNTICAGSPVAFTSTSFSSTGILSYAWSFPGGTPSTSVIANPMIVYNTPGTYPVTLTITTSAGNFTQTYTDFVVVPGVSISAVTPNPVCNGSQEQVNITGIALNNWSFTYNINGSGSTVVNALLPTHPIYIQTLNNNTTVNVTSVTTNNVTCPVNTSYTFNVINCCTNVLQNPSFEQGNTGFITDNGLNCSSMCPGHYCVGNYSGPSPTGTGFNYFTQIANRGNSLGYDGPSNPASCNTTSTVFPLPCGAYGTTHPGSTWRIWEQTVAITSGTNYHFSFFTTQGNPVPPFFPAVVLPFNVRVRVIDMSSVTVYNSGPVTIMPNVNQIWQQYSFTIPAIATAGNYRIVVEQFENFGFNFWDNLFDDFSLRPEVGTTCAGNTVFSVANGNNNINSAVLAAQLISSNSIAINDDLDINFNTTINCPDVRIANGKRIIVRAPYTLAVSSSWLHSCCLMWNGIEVENGAHLIINNNTIIEDASFAVNTLTTGSGTIPDLQISNTIFNKNERGVYYVSNNNDMTPAAANVIQNCVFTCRQFASTTPSAVNFNTIKDQLYNNMNAIPATVILTGIRGRAGLWMNGGLNHANGYEIGVGGTNASNGAGPVNVFDNLDFGIHANRAGNYIIRNNSFLNITGNAAPFGPNPYAFPFGVGISIRGSQGAANYVGIGGDASVANANEFNNFLNCNRGVSVYAYDYVYVYNCVMDNAITSPFSSFTTAGFYTGQHGIYLQPNGVIAGSVLKATGNVINNCAYGIHINRSLAYNGTNYRLECNQISSGGSSTQYLRRGIYLQDLTGNTTGMPLYGINVRFNTITWAEEQAIIADNIKRGLDISCNYELSVKYVPGPTSFPNTIDVIRLNNCMGVKVEANPSLKTSGGNTLKANPGITGIFINNSSVVGGSNIINNNKINYVGDCIVWAGDNSTSAQFKGNHMTNSRIGLYLYTNGEFTTQGAAGFPVANRWGATPTHLSINQTFNNSGLNPNTDAMIYVKNPSGTSTLMGVPNSHGGVPAYITGPGQGINTTTGSEPLFASCIGGCGGGSGSMALYEEDPYDFTLRNEEDAPVNLNKYLSGNSSGMFYNAERKWFGVKHAFDIMIDNPELISEELSASFEDEKYKSIKQLSEVELLIASGRFDEAGAKLAAITTNNAMENNLKTVYEILIGYQLYPTENYSSDLATLKTIANSCSFEAGPAVYKARAAYNAMIMGAETFYEDCPETPSVQQATSIDEQEAVNFSLFPNPNNGSMTVAYDFNENDQVVFAVFDVNGKKVAQQNINPSVNQMNIQQLNLEPGIYMYQVVVNGKLYAKNKFSVIR